MVVEDLYEAARRCNTDEEAAKSLGIDVSDFVRLCTISGIESPGQRKRRLDKTRGKGPSPLFRPAGADRVHRPKIMGLEDVEEDLSAWGLELWSDDDYEEDVAQSEDIDPDL